MAKFNGTRGSTGRIAWVFLPDSASTTGGGKTGLTNASAALNITVRREKSAAVTTYTGANIGTIATLGTWVNPGAGKVNFKEVDATNLPGLYELHFVDVLFDASDTSRWLAGMVTATGIAPAPFEVELDAVDLQDGTAAGLSRLDVTVGSRSTYAGTDTAGTTTLLARLTATRAGYLDNLSAGAVALASGVIVSAINNNVITAASINAAALNGKGDWLLASGYTAPPSAASIATTVWTDLLSGSDFGTAGSIGALLKLDIDAAISSRSTYAGGDTAGTTTLLARLTSGRAVNLDNLDATVSSRLATSGYTVPPTASAIADTTLRRQMVNVEGSASGDTLSKSSLYGSIQAQQKSSVSGTTLTVLKTDGTTLGAFTLTVSAGASPVTGVA